PAMPCRSTAASSRPSSAPTTSRRRTMDSVITWVVRSLHVLGAAVWIGGYAVLALVIVPALAQAADASIQRLALITIRVLSIAGALTIIAGLALVARSRGYAALLTGGEWGLNVISAAVLAIVL